jgi:hypothetical protein
MQKTWRAVLIPNEDAPICGPNDVRLERMVFDFTIDPEDIARPREVVGSVIRKLDITGLVDVAYLEEVH